MTETLAPPFWSHSPANKPGEKTWLTDRRRQDVKALYEWGLIPLAIADEMGLSDRATARYLLELRRAGKIPKLNPWLSTRGSA